MENARDLYLDEMVKFEGRGDFAQDERCSDCLSRGMKDINCAEYRCRNCFLPDLTCSACLIRRHKLNPFHNVDVSEVFLWALSISKSGSNSFPSAGMAPHFLRPPSRRQVW